MLTCHPIHSDALSDHLSPPRLSRLFDWVFYHVNSDDVMDESKAVYLRGLHQVLSNDGGKSPHEPILAVSSILGERECGWTSAGLLVVKMNDMIDAP